MPRITKAMTDVARAWLMGTRKTSGDYKTNGQTITYHGNTIARWVTGKEGKAFETSPGQWWTSVSTRGALNTILAVAHGGSLANQYLVKDGQLLLKTGGTVLTFSDIPDRSEPSGWSGGDLDSPSHGWVYWTIQ